MQFTTYLLKSIVLVMLQYTPAALLGRPSDLKASHKLISVLQILVCIYIYTDTSSLYAWIYTCPPPKEDLCTAVLRLHTSTLALVDWPPRRFVIAHDTSAVQTFAIQEGPNELNEERPYKEL